MAEKLTSDLLFCRITLSRKVFFFKRGIKLEVRGMLQLEGILVSDARVQHLLNVKLFKNDPFSIFKPSL